MLSQLQQELNYRFLQDRSSGLLVAHPNGQVDHSQQQRPQQQQVRGFKHPQQPVRRDSGQAMDTSVAPAPGVGGARQQQPVGFKWCYAHIHIARQIQQQQQRAKVRKMSFCCLVLNRGLSCFVCITVNKGVSLI